eukprot:g10799.t1
MQYNSAAQGGVGVQIQMQQQHPGGQAMVAGAPAGGRRRVYIELPEDVVCHSARSLFRLLQNLHKRRRAWKQQQRAKMKEKLEEEEGNGSGKLQVAHQQVVEEDEPIPVSALEPEYEKFYKVRPQFHTFPGTKSVLHFCMRFPALFKICTDGLEPCVRAGVDVLSSVVKDEGGKGIALNLIAEDKVGNMEDKYPEFEFVEEFTQSLGGASKHPPSFRTIRESVRAAATDLYQQTTAYSSAAAGGSAAGPGGGVERRESAPFTCFCETLREALLLWVDQEVPPTWVMLPQPHRPGCSTGGRGDQLRPDTRLGAGPPAHMEHLLEVPITPWRAAGRIIRECKERKLDRLPTPQLQEQQLITHTNQELLSTKQGRLRHHRAEARER